MSNVLDLVDQTVFLRQRASGATSLLQCVWVYYRAIGINGVRLFRHYLQNGPRVRRLSAAANSCSGRPVVP